MDIMRVRPRRRKVFKGCSQDPDAAALSSDAIANDPTPLQRKRLITRTPLPLVDPVVGNESLPKGTGVPETVDDRDTENPNKKHKEQTSLIEVKIDIPDRLKEFITETEYCYFEMIFSIEFLDGLQRLAWGLDPRAESIIICVKFSPKNNKNSDYGLFCVHSSTDEEDHEPRGSHRFCSTKSNADHAINEPCTPRSNILTIVLNRQLYGLLGERGCRKLDVIYDKVSETIKSDPNKTCLICDKEFNVKIYTPTACLGRCMSELGKWPLRARLSHLLSDVKSLDFLLCSIYTAVDGQKANLQAYREETSLLVGCPLELERVKPAIDTFPAISDMLSMSDLLKRGKYRSDRRRLLSWLPSRFRGCMVSLAPGADYLLKGQALQESHQFMVLNSRLERQEQFMQNVEGIRNTSLAFHGCGARRAFNILTDALRDPARLPGYSKTNHGVFFSNNFRVSFSYANARDGLFEAWKSSQFLGQAWSVIFGLAVAMHRVRYRDYQSSTSDESLLAVRYVFLLPAGRYPSHNSFTDIESMASTDQATMKKAFKTLDEGSLTPKHIGLRTRVELRDGA